MLFEMLHDYINWVRYGTAIAELVRGRTVRDVGRDTVRGLVRASWWCLLH